MKVIHQAVIMISELQVKQQKLSDAQVVELDAINPIGYSTQSETVPGGMVKLDAPIAEVLEIIPPEAFQVVDNGDETVTLTPFDDTDDDGIFDGANADANERGRFTCYSIKICI